MMIEVLSDFAFNFSLRHNIKALSRLSVVGNTDLAPLPEEVDQPHLWLGDEGSVNKVGRCRSPVLRISGGGANGDLDLLELIDVRSYKLQCNTAD